MADNTFRIDVVVGDNGKLKLAERGIDRVGDATKRAGQAHRGANRDAQDFFNTQAKGVIGTANSTRSFSKLAESIGKGGSSGLVGAYATLAANVFAVSAAFNALRGAAQVEQIFRGLEAAGTRTGLSLMNTSNALKEVTGSAIDTEQAMRSTAQIVSAGFDSKTVERLGQAARDTSFALGRNMTDSLDRLTRGIVKLEPELLDELGLMTKLTESNVNYARQMGKSESQLTSFEKRQGFANAVLAEAELKFGGLSKATGNSNAYDQLASNFKNLNNELFSFINLAGKPIASILAKDVSTLAGVMLLFASSLKNQLLPGLASSVAKSNALAQASKELAKEKLALVGAAKKEAEALQASNLAAKSNVTYMGTKLPNVYAAHREDLLKTIGTTDDLTAAQKKGMNSLASSIRANRGILTNNPDYAKGTDKGDAKRTEQAALIREQRGVQALAAARRQAATFDVENETKVAAARRAAAAARSTASSAEAASASVGAASQLKLGESWKQLTRSVAAYGRAQALSATNGITLMGRLSTAAFAASTAVKVLGTAFLTALPYIGLAVVAFGLLKSAYEALKSDATKKLEKAVESLGETTRKANEFGAELVRINESQATAAQRAAAAITIQANAVREATEKYSEFAIAFREKNVSDNVADLFGSDIEDKVATFWQTLGTRGSLSYLEGLKKNSKALDLAEILQTKTLFGTGSGKLDEGAKQAVGVFNTLEQTNKKGLDAAIKARGGYASLKDTLKGMSNAQVVDYFDRLGKEVNSLTNGNEDNVKGFQESMKNLGNTLADFSRTSIPSTPYDTLVKSFISAEDSVEQLKKSLDPAQMSALLSGLDAGSVRALNIDTQLDVAEYNKAAEVVQRIKALRKDLESRGEKLDLTSSTQLRDAEETLRVNKDLGTRIATQITQRSELLKQGQEEERLSKSRLALLNAQIQMNARIYQQGAAGLKARFEGEDRSRKLQIASLQTQIDITRAISGQSVAMIQKLEINKADLEIEKQKIIAIADQRRVWAESMKAQAALNLQQQGIGEAEALQKTQNGLLSVDRLAGPIRARAQAMNTWRQLDTILDGTLDKSAMVADKDKEIAAVEGRIKTIRRESVDTMQQIAALQNQIKTIQESSLDPQQRAAELLQAQRQYYSQLLDSVGNQAKSLGELDDTYRSIDATLAGVSDRLDYQIDQIRRRSNIERQELSRNKQAALGDLSASLQTAQADLAREKRQGVKADIEAAQTGVTFAQNALDIANSDYSISLQRIDAAEQLAVAEKAVFDTRKEGLEWQQNALEYTQKQLDNQRALSTEIQRGYELRMRLDAKRNNRELGTEGEEAIAIKAAADAYKFAVQEVNVKKGLIDLEYALLDAQKQQLESDLRARRDNLDAADPRNVTRLAQLNATIERLENVDLSVAAETAKATIDRTIENARLELQTAMTRSVVPSIFGQMSAGISGIVERFKQRQAAEATLENARPASGTSKVVKPETVEERASNAQIENPLIATNNALISKINEWIEVIRKVQDMQLRASQLPDSGTVSGTASAITKQVIDFFTSKGYTLNQAAGIAGNMQQESSMDPRKVNPESGMAGLAQFSKRNQAEFMKQFGHGIAQSTVNEQLTFINDQLNGTEGAAKRLLKSANTIAEAAVAFRKGYERPGIAEANDAKRIQYAENAVSRNKTAETPMVALNAVVPVSGAIQQEPQQSPEIVVRANKPEPKLGADISARDSDLAAPDISAMKDKFAPLGDALDAYGVLSSKLITDLEALGPEGQIVSAVATGMSTIGNATLNAFKVMDTSSLTSAKGITAMAEVASAGLATVSSALAAGAQAKEDAIQREIDAETRRDGKSAESIAKITALEKKKDDIARKQFNTNKKIMMAQAVIATAAGVAQALTLGPIVGPIMAGVIGAMGAAQLAIISGTSYQSTASSATAAATSPSLTIGKRGDSVDVAKQNKNLGGEIGYLRGNQGTGTNSSNYNVIGSAYGGAMPRGYGSTAYVVGEKGPETITPEMPMTVTPANDNRSGNPVSAEINIHAIDAKGVHQVLRDQRGNIISMLREAANTEGQRFMEDVNVNEVSRPSVGKLL